MFSQRNNPYCDLLSLANKNDLFNGNIPFMQTSLPDVASYNANGAVVNQSLGNVYQYDQLNRLVEHRVFDNYDITNNNWLNTPLNNGTDKFYENFTYDANGNILNINRNGANTGTGLAMDNFTYRYNNNASQVIYPSSSSTGYCTYPMQSNKLYHVNDAVAATNYTEDVDDQGGFTPTQNTINTANNYGYDEIGNLVRDDAENIQNITWNVYGKIESISRTGNNNKPNLAFTYDAAGQRISKTVMPRNNGVLSSENEWTTTFYVRDATGNVMATYSQKYTPVQGNQIIKEEIKLKELHLYGSSRLGIYNSDQVMATQEYNISGYNSNGTFTSQSVMFNTLVTTEVSPLPTIFTVYKGKKQYELSNHLGNVLATISDRRVPRDDNGDLLIDYFNADILSTSDYYAFGSGMSTRAIGGYRYSFNGKETDSETGLQDYGFRIYNPSLGKFLSVDPLVDEYPYYTPYQFAGDMPIWAIDLDGLEPAETRISSNSITNHCFVLPSVNSFKQNQSVNKKQTAANVGMKTPNPSAKTVGLSFYTRSDAGGFSINNINTIFSFNLGPKYGTNTGDMHDYRTDVRFGIQTESFYSNYFSTPVIYKTGTQAPKIQHKEFNDNELSLINKTPLPLIGNSALLSIWNKHNRNDIATQYLPGAFLEFGTFLTSGATLRLNVSKTSTKFYNQATFNAFERQLAKDGMKSILKTQSRIQKNLAEHLQKLGEIKKAGGFSSSVEREIKTFQSQLDAINDLLK